MLGIAAVHDVEECRLQFGGDRAARPPRRRTRRLRQQPLEARGLFAQRGPGLLDLLLEDRRGQLLRELTLDLRQASDLRSLALDDCQPGLAVCLAGCQTRLELRVALAQEAALRELRQR